MASCLVVAGNVRVEQEQGHAANLGLPDVGVQGAAGGERDLDDAGLAALFAKERQRETVGVEDRVALVLPALTGERLGEVAGLVEQADAHDRDAEVRSGLEVVAGEDAEATGVLRQDSGDAELWAEVGDRLRDPTLVGLLLRVLLEPARGGHVHLEGGARGVDPLDERLIAGKGGELGRAHPGQELHGVFVDLTPASGIDGFKQVSGARVPTPPEVEGEVAQSLDGLGEHGTDAEATNSFHVARA